ncbi:uncharacterized protein J4E88_010105 [Alternaria novae-zelandiae]|uniref:uncharacterized protein n=1 Tax=Alternaria novae-zelandiae TaxID=430562 RepID=UPI0020C49B4A|nr:uncharacterized protein J4E88_010105 [Alternaria novae-zelandiae]KAI4667853.1 hypothetical protein J4E88_010105 [Alternaria novae-zelandiae]
MSQLSLENDLSHAKLDEISAFWFRHLQDQDHIISPSIEDSAPWFSQNDAFDRECTDKFGGLLKLIQVLEPNGADIVAAAKPCKPMHWISLIILLDQLPRNCFRGAQARVAFTVFDSLALAVASKAIDSGVPKDSEVRFRLAYRFWFYMPMEHCESLAVAESLHKAHFDMFRDYERLLERDVEGWDGKFAQYRDVLLKRRSDFGKLKGVITSICESKLDALRRFGRFPQRNEVLDRTSTAEELQFLDGK